MKSQSSAYLAEAMGTFAIIFFGCGSIMLNTAFHLGLPYGIVPLVFGLTVMIMIYAFGPTSGAHFNPAVSLGFVMSGHFSLSQTGRYALVQTIGALLACFMLKLIFPQALNFGDTAYQCSITTALLIEILLSFFLMLTILSVAKNPRAHPMMAGLTIGAMVTVGALFGGPLTGASMNPVRSLAPAILSGHLTQTWLYVLGPIIGTSLAGLFYKRLIPARSMQ